MNTFHKPKPRFSRFTSHCACLLFSTILLFSTLLLSACGTDLTSSETQKPFSSESQYHTSNENPDSTLSKDSEAKDSQDSSNTPVSAGQMEIHFLDVGQGLSILVMSEDEVLIYDGGDQNYSAYVISYLKKQGVDKIDYLISSHYDSDHVSGLIGCLYAFPVETVIGADYVHNSRLYESFQSAVANQGLTVNHPEVGTTYHFGSGTFTILSPDTTYNDSNNNSIAIKLTNGEDNFIFMGDAEYESESAMINSGIDLSCDVLCLGHHGSASSTSWDFLQASVPDFGVLSCGADNAHGHPHEETMEKLSSMEIPVFRTDIQGTVTAISDGTSITWNVPPCNDYSSGEETEFTGNKDSEIIGETENTDESTYILNISTRKFHLPDCSSIPKMSDSNKEEFTGTRDEVVNMGYEPCGNCKP